MFGFKRSKSKQVRPLFILNLNLLQEGLNKQQQTTTHRLFPFANQ